MSLSGRKVLLTGASGEIGRACAVELACRGARLVLGGRNEKALQQTSALLVGTGHQIIVADLSDPELDLETVILVPSLAADGIKFGGFVHAAGIGDAYPLRVVDRQLMQRIFDVNFFSFLSLVKILVKKQYSSGINVVVVSSVAARAGWAGNSVYAASKAALEAAIRSLGIEFSGRKCRFNAVAPGHIDTAMFQKMNGILPDRVLAELQMKQPLGLGNPQDVAQAVGFLLDDTASRLITGSVLTVDGGFLAQ